MSNQALGIKSSRFIILALCSIALVDGNSGLISKRKQSQEQQISMSEDTAVLADPLIRFSSNLLKAVDHDKKNVIFSPMSIHMALNLVLVGATPETETEKELKSALGYNALDKPIEKIHEAYANLAAQFKSIRESAQKEAARKANLSQEEAMYDAQPSLPVMEMWTLAIPKDAEILPEYKQHLQKYYNGSMVPISAKNTETQDALVKKVNSWAKDAGFESDLLTNSELKEDFKMLLMSAVKLQAFWTGEFNERKLDKPFYNDGIKDKQVNNFEGLSARDLHASLVEFAEPGKISYKSHQALITSNSQFMESFEQLRKLNFRAIMIPMHGDLSFTIFEPLEQGAGTELNKLAEALFEPNPSDNDRTRLIKALEIVDSQDARAKLDYMTMPKFNFESDIDLLPPLKSMGLRKVFDKFKAELTKISTDKLYVDKAKHQAVIEVNKFGIKAAGVTKLRIALLMAIHRSSPIRIDVQNPFIFVIRFGKLPLFVGQLSHI